MEWFAFNINHLRAVVTLLSFISFAGVVAWAWSKRNQRAFDEAAMLPFLAEPTPETRPAPPRSGQPEGDVR